MLRIRLDINVEPIVDLEVCNLGPAETGSACQYRVRRIADPFRLETGSTLFYVEHHPADGAKVLARKVLAKMEEADGSRDDDLRLAGGVKGERNDRDNAASTL